MMRIISGTLRNRKLVAPKGHLVGLNLTRYLCRLGQEAGLAGAFRLQTGRDVPVVSKEPDLVLGRNRTNHLLRVTVDSLDDLVEMRHANTGVLPEHEPVNCVHTDASLLGERMTRKLHLLQSLLQAPATRAVTWGALHSPTYYTLQPSREWTYTVPFQRLETLTSYCYLRLLFFYSNGFTIA